MPSATTASPATIHPASRIDAREHDPRVVEMVNTPISLGVLDYFLDFLVLAVASAMIGPQLKLALGLKTIKTASFVHSFVWATKVATPTLLVALVYIDRIKSKLSIDCEDWICERLAVGALITAEKYLRDAGVKAEQWATCANISKADVNRIEREFLALLDFDMRVTDAHLLALHPDFMRAARADADRETRAAASPPGTSIFARRERAVYHYKIQDRAEERRSSPPAPAPVYLPDLLYPDSPEEKDTPPVITPPDSNDLGLRFDKPQYGRRRTANPYVAAAEAAASSRVPAAYPSHRPHHRDVEMEARMRWYAADARYPSSRPAKSSPRWQPYSPPSRRYGSPPRPARSQQRPSQDYPWRSLKWSSDRRDDVWGPSGL
ncbi:hypothetical protein PYCCODRAFT_1468341 [Trametes coccinea BRFM310]|uniref:Cyclin N-terminal domain-containing protein n=1 Tax=Trametes coccinea (strain BRFM310) TaxID=1353009 RepID=A0A1Y2INE2_TRAC3|nr:hypothetical protein PYCCODRAFT_1468341 [Trametes coccinea BRFM310]